MDINLNFSLLAKVATIACVIYYCYSLVRVPDNMLHIPRFPALYTIFKTFTGVPFINQTDELMSLYREHGILRLFFKGKWVIINGDAELFKKIALDHSTFDKLTPHDFAPNSLIDKLLGTNIIFSNHKDWKRHRKAINPAFKKAWNLNVFSECLEELFEKMGDSDVNEVDVDDMIQRITVEALGREIMDVRFDGILLEEKPRFISNFNYLMNTGLNPLYFIFPILDHPWNPFRFYAYRKLEYVNQYFDQLLQERKERISKSRDMDHRDILSLMLVSNMHDPNGLTDEEMKHNTLLFFLAGQDTTTFTICATLHLLAEHPHVQEKVRQEVLSVFGKNEYEDGKFQISTNEQLDRLEYIYAVIQESMRLYPAVSVVTSQYCTKEIYHRGHTIPANTMIDTNIYAIQRNPDYFKDPTSFDPSRFLNHIDTHKLDSNWFAFSAGSRFCLGSGFSITQQKIVLSYMLRRYRVKPSGSLPSGKPLQVKIPFLLKTHNLRLDFEHIL